MQACTAIIVLLLLFQASRAVGRICPRLSLGPFRGPWRNGARSLCGFEGGEETFQVILGMAQQDQAGHRLTRDGQRIQGQ